MKRLNRLFLDFWCDLLKNVHFIISSGKVLIWKLFKIWLLSVECRSSIIWWTVTFVPFLIFIYVCLIFRHRLTSVHLLFYQKFWIYHFSSRIYLFFFLFFLLYFVLSDLESNNDRQLISSASLSITPIVKLLALYCLFIDVLSMRGLYLTFADRICIVLNFFFILMKNNLFFICSRTFFYFIQCLLDCTFFGGGLNGGFYQTKLLDNL